MNATLEPTQKVVGREQWLAARTALLAEERELTHRRDDLARRRRELPWVRVGMDYLFETPVGHKSLGELFDGRKQLVVYHFMLGPDWPEGCPSCSMAADGFDGVALHLAQRDVTFMAVSRAPLAQIEAFKRRMGWGFTWASSNGNDFNHDYGVSFTKDELARGGVNYNFGTTGFPAEEAPGVSVFVKDTDGSVYHTYSAYARGLEPLLGVYFLLDMVPNGRAEEGLPFPMAWVRHHDKYGAPSHGNGAGCGCGANGGRS